MPTHIDTHWVDIVPPPAPAHAADPLAIVTFLTLLLALLAVAIWLYRRPRYRNRRTLRRMAQALRSSPGDTRSVCFDIPRCLRSGLAQQRLRAIAWVDANPTEWRDYLDRLTRYCYSADVPGANEVDGMIREARVWLERKAANC
jgi:hypothetical protein